MNKSVAIVLVLLVFAFLTGGRGGVASAQAPDGAPHERVQQQRAPAACPPDIQWGCVLSGSISPGLTLNSTSTANNVTALYATLNDPGSGAAAVWGRVLGATSTSGYGVYGSHQGSGYGVYGNSNTGIGFFGFSNTNTGMQGQTNSTGASPGVLGIHQAASGTGAGVVGRTNSTSTGATGVLGVVSTTSAASQSAGLRGINNGTGASGNGVWGSHAGSGWGVWGTNGLGNQGGLATHQAGAYGFSSSGKAGVYGLTSNGVGTGVFGEANGIGAAGVFGRNESGAGVWGYTPSGGSGVYGESGGVAGLGVFGNATGVDGIGVRGEAHGGGMNFGVYGTSSTNHGVGGFSTSGAGVLGESGFIGVQGATGGTTSNDQGVRGIATAPDAWAGYFDGKAGARNGFFGPFHAMQVDHPTDPANRTLSHAAVQSSDMMNVYSGNVTTDANGKATVTLPDYFEALNTDFRYQLTVIGTFAQAIVSEEIADNQFTIRTDQPSVKVSWQVIGIRNDRWAAQNRLQVEEWKPAADRGRYLHPEVFGQPVAEAVERNQQSALQEPLEERGVNNEEQQGRREMQADAPPAPTGAPAP
jgi:hypothetical protein